jgi:hypothetical protein
MSADTRRIFGRAGETAIVSTRANPRFLITQKRVSLLIAVSM